MGLPFLTETVTALGGTLTAGPHGDEWRFRLEVPQ
jgi:hypothetical protein